MQITIPMELNKIHNIDCLAGLKLLADKSVHCIVTSPPYWMLLDYGITGQLGLEPTPKRYINAMSRVFKECQRVLRDDGTLWINIGDSYASAAKNRTKEQASAKSTINGSLRSQQNRLKQSSKIVGGLKPKDLVGIPWMLAFQLRKIGYYLRQDIIWSKPFGMPESVIDRCTKSHEYLFLLSKKQKYYFDSEAIKTPIKESSVGRFSQNIDSQNGSAIPFKQNGNMKPKVKGYSHKGGNQRISGHSGNMAVDGTMIGDLLANKRSVWTVNPSQFPEAHFATFPEELIKDCIKAGCPPGGTVLDIFIGTGTTALVAQKLGRNFIGFELNPKYVEMANKRLNSHLGMFSPDNMDAENKNKAKIKQEALEEFLKDSDLNKVLSKQLTIE